jgi:hypothetical protein
MLRYIINVLIIATLVLIPQAAGADDWRLEECRFNTLRAGQKWTTYEVEKTIRCATTHWAVPGGTYQALDVARCESGVDLLDYSRDGYAGTYQHSTQYWPARRANLKPEGWTLATSVYNPRSNVVIAIRMARSGWHAWTCA